MRALALMLTLALGLEVAAAAPTPARTVITNTAYIDLVESDGLPHSYTSPPVSVTVAAVCAVRLSPAEQTLQSPVGVRVPFTFTVTNLGNDTFTFPIQVKNQHPDMTSSVDPESVRLAQGESRDVTLWLVATEPGRHSAQLTTSCAGGEPQVALGHIDATRQPVTITKAVDAATALPGDIITYTLTVHNPNAAAVHQVQVTDPLSRDLIFISSEPAPVRFDTASNTLTYELPVIAPQSDAVITIKAKVTEQKDATRIENVASTHLPSDQPLVTPPVVTDVWDGKLSIAKNVDRNAAQVGERLNYTVTVTNASLNASFKKVLIKDVLPPGVVLDTSSLKLNGQPVIDLNPDPLVIEVEGPALRAKESAVLTYTVTVSPAALGSGKLTNVAEGAGTPDAPFVRPVVKTPPVDVTVYVTYLQRATLIGRVFLDYDGNKVFSDKDVAVKGARVMVAGIGSVLTDAQGRYGIADLRAGRYGMQLQTADLGGDPTAKGGDYGLAGARIADA